MMKEFQAENDQREQAVLLEETRVPAVEEVPKPPVASRTPKSSETSKVKREREREMLFAGECSFLDSSSISASDI